MMFQYNKTMFQADPIGRVGLRHFACWDCVFEYRREHGCLYLVNVVCCQVEVSRTGCDHSSRGVLPTAVRDCASSGNLRNEEAMALVVLQCNTKTKNTVF